jgi:hypothetical protein
MIQELLGQTNFVGRDGFYWWMGQVETEKGSQEKGDDRYKVRIVGQHLKNCDAVPYEDLPWAIVMMPPNAPRREGNGDYQSVKYKSGDWVIGFFLDGRDGQQPVIMGSLGQQYKASTTHIGKEKPEGECLAFTTFMEREVNPTSGISSTEQDKVKQGGLTGNAAAAGTNSSKQPDLNKPVNNKNENASAQLLATKCSNSETNPSGEYFCVEVSDAKCESTDNDKSKFQTILTDLFANVQSSGGKAGTQIVSNYTGKLYDYIDIAQSYTNKLSRLANSLVGRIKGEIFALIKQGSKEILNFLLTEEVVDTDATNAAMNAAASAGKDPNSVKPIKKRVGRLRGITAWINEQLKKVNCTMEDLDQKLRDFLEELIFGALENVFNAARCFVDQIVNDIFEKISSFLEDAINSILGPLQALLTVISSPLDILGAAIKQIFDILGITCGAASQSCASKEQTSNCSGSCPEQEDNANYLDDLINAIENGNLDTSSGNCDTTSVPSVPETTVTLVGGTTDPTSYTSSTPVLPTSTTTSPTLTPSTYISPTTGLTPTTPASTITPTTTTTSTITPTTVTPITTGPTITPLSSSAFTNLFGLLDAPIVGNLNLSLSDLSNTSANEFIKFGVDGNSQINITQNLILNLNGFSETDFVSASVVGELITYNLTASKTIVTEGETIVFTLVANGGVIDDNTMFDYAIFGDVTSADFQNNTTVGTMRMIGNVATAIITIAEDALEEPVEVATFNIKNIGKAVAFSIASNIKTTTTTSTTVSTFTLPSLGTPEVCSDGRIMEIPIVTKGDAYIVPPLAIIRGSGYGASAKVELDEKGYINKIKITRAGIGYKPKRVRTNCTVGQIVLKSLGNGYYKQPTVYVNGKSNIARAIINDAGGISNIEIIDKTKIFECTPKVEIFGGNGLGATAFAIMECRDDILYSEFQQGVAPSGTDKVIDCP